MRPDDLCKRSNGVINKELDGWGGLRPETYSTYQLFNKDDLVFKLIDLENFQTSRVGIVHEDGIMSPVYIRLVAGSKYPVHSKYFYYQHYSLYQRGIYNSLGEGVRSALTAKDLLEMEVTIPSIEEQERIARFLDEKTAVIDSAIAKKERLIRLLEEQKQILVKTAVTHGLNPNAPTRPSGIDWIGDIPAHWEVKNNRYLFVEQNGRSKKGEEIHLSMSQKLGLVPSSELSVLTLQSESYEGAKLCLKDDLVLNRLKAHLAVFSVAPCDGLVSPDYSVFRLAEDGFNPFYFENLFKTPIYLSEFNRKVKGIVVGFYRLYSGDFKSIPCLVPPAKEQSQIMQYISLLEKKSNRVKQGIKREIRILKELKSVVIAEAVTGKIKI